MIGVIESLVEGKDSDEAKGILREHLQKSILRGLSRTNAMPVMSFHGGTSLRIVHNTQRYSEDLDFAVDGDTDYYEFGKWMRRLGGYLKREGYEPNLKEKDPGQVVRKVWVEFPGLLHRVGMSPHKSQNFRIKLEADTRPPAGARSERMAAHAECAPEGNLFVWVHDRPTLMAGKLAAFLSRRYQKGRDVFDLDWFLRQRPVIEPNFEYLGAALAQSWEEGRAPDPSGWRAAVEEKLGSADWGAVREEMRRFAIKERDADRLSFDSIRRGLRAHRPSTAIAN